MESITSFPGVLRPERVRPERGTTEGCAGVRHSVLVGLSPACANPEKDGLRMWELWEGAGEASSQLCAGAVHWGGSPPHPATLYSKGRGTV